MRYKVHMCCLLLLSIYVFIDFIQAFFFSHFDSVTVMTEKLKLLLILTQPVLLNCQFNKWLLPSCGGERLQQRKITPSILIQCFSCAYSPGLEVEIISLQREQKTKKVEFLLSKSHPSFQNPSPLTLMLKSWWGSMM